MSAPDFVLGCERSGTTWVANLLDAHPRTEVYLEPLAAFARIFPGLPDRFELAPSDPASISGLQTGCERLGAMKHPYLYRPGRAPLLRRLDASWAGLRAGLARRLGTPVPLDVLRHGLLNLHASQTPSSLLARETPHDRVPIVKELRLNLRVELIRRAFPGARCLVVVRDPAAQVASVTRLFGRGHLHELRSALPRLGLAVLQCERLHRYHTLAEPLVRDATSADALLAWWLISYDVLLADCRRLEMAHRVVFHEDLSRDPLREARALLAFFGLDACAAVERYARASSSGSAGEDGPLSTFRASAVHSTRTRAEAPSALRRAAVALIESHAESEALHRYAARASLPCPHRAEGHR